MSENESRREIGGGPENELPPELKAVEAELASLRPREDRLDRERLVFRAGQTSAGGDRASRGAAARGAWPAAFAGMTAVAAALAVALAVRPGPQVVERVRIVKVPVASDEAAESRTDTREGDLPPGPRQVVPRPRAESGDGASPRGDLPLQPDWSRFGSRGEYLEAIDRMLAQGKDPWSRPAAESEQGDAPSKPPTSDAPPPYREWLKTMLDDHARADSPGGRTTGPHRAGANS